MPAAIHLFAIQWMLRDTFATRNNKKSKVMFSFVSLSLLIKASHEAVTLEGTVIHKSGLITGGRSTHNAGKKWDEKDVQGMF